MTDDEAAPLVDAANVSVGRDPDAVLTGVSNESDALLTRLRVIEEQPLEARATAYVQVHDELRTKLEGSDQATSRG